MVRDVRGVKKRHPLGSIPSRSGVSELTAESGVASITGPGVKISALPAADGATGGDQFEVNQAGTSKRLSVYQLLEAFSPGGGGITPPALTDVSPRSFGAVGDGVTDDTAALQAAINAVNAAGGGNVNCTGGRWLIDSANLVVKRGVFLVGPWRNFGRPGANVGDFSTTKSAFIVNPSFTINLGDHDCGIQGMVILRKGLTAPSNIRTSVDAVTAFAGTAVTVGDGVSHIANDCWLSQLFIAGFAQAISSNQTDRLRIEYISGDNLAGIAISNSFDMQHMTHVHFWPFVSSGFVPVAYAVSGAVNNGGLVRLTIATSVLVTGDRVTVKSVGGVTGASGPFIATVINPTTIDLQGSTFGGAYTSGGTVTLGAWYRSGVGINLDTSTDWGEADTCFTYNYAIGIRVNSSNQVTLVNCGTDSYGPTADTSTVGMLVTGTSKATALVAPKTAAQGVGLKCDSSASGRDAVHVTNHRAWGNLTYAVEVSDGYASFVNSEADTAQVIRIDDNASGVSFVGGDLTGATFSYQSAASVRPSYVNVRGTVAPINSVVNGVSGSTRVARFDGHYSTPAVNDTIFKSTYLTDSSGTQVEVIRESYRASSVTAGAMTSRVFWGITNAGSLADTLQLTTTGLSPVANDLIALGGTTNSWSDLFLASGGVIGWNNGTYTLTQSGATLTASGTLAITGSALVGYGTAVPFSMSGGSFTPQLQLALAGSTNLSVQRYSASTTSPVINLSKSASATAGAQALVSSTDNLGTVNFNGSDGTGFVEGAYIRATIDSTPGAGSMPTALAFGLTPSGSVNAQERMRISSAGIVTFPAASPVALSATAVAAGSATQAFIKASSTANLGIYYGTGVPSFSAAKGSIYSCTNATTTTTRLYVNTDGAGTWATITTSA